MAYLRSGAAAAALSGSLSYCPRATLKLPWCVILVLVLLSYCPGALVCYRGVTLCYLGATYYHTALVLLSCYPGGTVADCPGDTGVWCYKLSYMFS